MRTRLFYILLLPAMSVFGRPSLRPIPVAPIPDAPAGLSRISVNVYRAKGSPAARLVLLSGWTCGAAWLHYPARYLAGQGIEVWTVNRRAVLFEDRARFQRLLFDLTNRDGGLRGKALRTLSSPANFNRYPLAYLKEIGIRRNMQDIHAVIRAATKDNLPVYLGGWSDGVEFVMAYSLSEFEGGVRGHSLLKGLVLIDENPEWGRVSPASQATRARQERARIDAGNLYEVRYPAVTLFEAAGVLAGTNVSPLSASFRRPFSTGNSLLGWLVGGRGSAWSWLFSCGRIKWGRPYGWTKGGNTPLSRIAGMHRAPGGVWEWFYPRRIMADYWELGSWGMQSPDMGITPDRKNRLPVYSAYSSMNRFYGPVPAGLEWYRRRTGIKRKNIRTVKLYNLKHGDILLSPKAEIKLWLPLSQWLQGTAKGNQK